MITQLAYISRPVDDLSSADVESILGSARTRNRALDVTGILAYRHDVFLQVLEGDRGVVSQLFARILVDRRHADVLLVGSVHVSRRVFGEWSMGYLSFGRAVYEALERFTGNAELDAASIQHDQLVGLLAHVATRLVARQTVELRSCQAESLATTTGPSRRGSPAIS